MWSLPLAAAGVSGLFSALLFQQWWGKRRPNLLAWCIALAMFSAASLTAVVGMIGRWTPTWFRIYYLLGAVVNVPVLALGTVYLFAPRRTGHAAAAAVAIASVVAAFVVLSAALKTGAAQALETNGIPSGSTVFPLGVRMLARYFSFTGFFVVVGGALWSAWRLGRKKQPHLKRLVVANMLIATGTIVVALGSGFAFYGRGFPFAVGLAVGVTIMFSGFLKTRPPSGRGAAESARAASQ